ncbi:MAG TPA: GldG family protein [Bryobacteraceae bacterium]|nr:GldG family protein [Bryobacteraceae bacterium]
MATQQQQRRAANFAQAAVYTLIAIAILGIINFLANRYNKSLDVTANKRYTLSDQTEKIAKNLKGDITIAYWDQPSKFPGAHDLLDRYKNLSTKIDVQYNDADKQLTKARAAGVKALPTIFIQIGSKKEEAKSLTEEEVTGALVRVLKGGDRTVCFTLGSGEPSLEDSNPREGYSSLKQLIERNNYKTQTVKLLEKPQVPMECTILVVGGPKRDYIPPEVAAIKGYLEDGGKLLVMMDPPLKFAGNEVDENKALTDVLAGWGVKLQRDLVLDTSGIGQVFGLGPEFPLVTKYESHAIVREMKDTPAGFPIARSMETTRVDKANVEPLFQTTEDSFATLNLAAQEIKPGPNDLKGPLTLGVAGTYTTGKEAGNGRFVVVGSSRWVSNGFLAFNGNRDLFMNMINWLSSDEDLISIRPKEPEDRPLNMNSRQMTMMFYSSVLMIPLLVVVAGVGVWWRRR